MADSQTRVQRREASGSWQVEGCGDRFCFELPHLTFHAQYVPVADIHGHLEFQSSTFHCLFFSFRDTESVDARCLAIDRICQHSAARIQQLPGIDRS